MNIGDRVKFIKDLKKSKPHGLKIGDVGIIDQIDSRDYVVKFPNGVRLSFWKDELEVLKSRELI